MTDNMTYETYKEVPHQHRYDTVVEWAVTPAYKGYTFLDGASIPARPGIRKATRVMCSDCLDVKELN